LTHKERPAEKPWQTVLTAQVPPGSTTSQVAAEAHALVPSVEALQQPVAQSASVAHVFVFVVVVVS